MEHYSDSATLGRPIRTKKQLLVKDIGLEEILKKIEGAGSLQDSLLALGSTKPFTSDPSQPTPLPRVDNNPHVFLDPTTETGI